MYYSLEPSGLCMVKSGSAGETCPSIRLEASCIQGGLYWVHSPVSDHRHRIRPGSVCHLAFMRFLLSYKHESSRSSGLVCIRWHLQY
jgi:hypothetical protein